MNMVDVRSKHIVAIGHDPAKSELVVKFKTGGTYTYHGVSVAEHAALMASDSKGEHLHARIKPGRKVTTK